MKKVLIRSLILLSCYVLMGCNSVPHQEEVTAQTSTYINISPLTIDTDTMELPKRLIASKPTGRKSTHSEEVSSFAEPKTPFSKPDYFIVTPDSFKLDWKKKPFLLTQNPDTVGLITSPERVLATGAYAKSRNPFSFSFYNRFHGLWHDDISTLFFDSKGKLWVGTYGGGVIRFDGQNFEQFTLGQGLPQNHVLAIEEDSLGRMWFGTRHEGISVYDGFTFVNYTMEQGLSSNNIECFLKDDEGNIWIGTFGGGVNIYNYEGFSVLGNETPLQDLEIFDLHQDKQGNIWIATRNTGLIKHKDNHFYFYTKEKGLPDSPILSIHESNDGTLWFASGTKGALLTNGEVFYQYTQSHGLHSNELTDILSDKDGNIWFASNKSGVAYFDGEYFYHLSEQDGLLTNYITSLALDASGTLWFGSYGGGLGTFKGNIFRHFDHQSGLKDSFIRAILHDSHGNTWMGSNNGGVFVYKNDRLLNYTESNGLSSNRIRALLEDSSGTIWVGNDGGGLHAFKDNTFFHYDENSGLKSNLIQVLFEDDKGNIWIGTRDKGLVKFDGNTFVYFTQSQGLASNNIRQIKQDKDGTLWLATYKGGIISFDGRFIKNYTTQQGLISDNYFDIHIDSHNHVWATSDGTGIIKIKKDSFLRFTENEGLSSNFVYAVYECSEGFLWFGTRMGLSWLNPQVKEAFIENKPHLLFPLKRSFFKNFTFEEGFWGLGVNSRSMAQDSNGQIWIGANDLLTLFKPPNMLQNPKPNVEIRGVGLFGEFLPWVELKTSDKSSFQLSSGIEISDFSFSRICTQYHLPENLVLPYTYNYITFYFGALTPDLNPNLRYRYMLEGHDRKWNYPVFHSEAHFGNLPPGNYSFRLQSVDYLGQWSEESTFDFIIREPWWWTNWAKILWVVLFLVLIIIAIRLIKRQLQQKQIEHQKEMQLEQKVQLAKRSVEIKQNFLSHMSHEMRTPLTGVIGASDLLSKTALNDEQRDLLNVLKQSGEHLKETINLVLDFSKIEAGKTEVQKIEFSLKNLFDEAYNLFHSICVKDISFHAYIDPGIPDVLESDPAKIGQIIRNFLSNAVKFTQTGSIALRASLMNIETNQDQSFALVKIELSDTGVGISPEDQNKLFQAFNQLQHSKVQNFDGTGLGLAISKELALLLGGNIGLYSNKEEGSTFWFSFRARLPFYGIEKPKKPSLPQEEDIQAKSEAQVQKTSALKVLLVEDKAVNQKVIGLLLSTMGHQVHFASNGREALDVFEPASFDVILMDIQMPVMDGITAMQKLKNTYGKEELPPIIGLSANAFEGDREKYMNQGMDEYLTKPFDENDFRKMVKQFFL